jgi:hypothetical protein
MPNINPVSADIMEYSHRSTFHPAFQRVWLLALNFKLKWNANRSVEQIIIPRYNLLFSTYLKELACVVFMEPCLRCFIKCNTF